MVSGFLDSKVGAILRVALFALLGFGVSSQASSITWFHAKGPVGEVTREFSVAMTLDTVPVFLGNQREAPAAISGQTFMATKFSLEASFVAADTSFWWHGVFLFKRTASEALPEPVWASVLRGGRGENEWLRLNSQGGKRKAEYHSPIYGDGVHEWEASVFPEEFLFPIAIQLASKGGEIRFKTLAPVWELPYTRKTYSVKGLRTEQRLKLDDVESVLVQFEREDGAISEFWISERGHRILRARTFRGLWLERIQ